MKVVDRNHTDIMGTEYAIKFGSKKFLGMSEENLGECKIFSKEILVCTEAQDCSAEELKVRTMEIIAHEVFHAYANEAGLDLEPNDEERVATFFMKNFDKMNDTIEELYQKWGFDSSN